MPDNQPMSVEKDAASWSCNACPWTHTAHPLYGWSKHDDRAVEVHQTMLCPDARTADGHACIGDDCPGCAAALARPLPPAGGSVREAAIRAVNDLESQEVDPSVEQYVDAVLSVLPPAKGEGEL